MFFARQLFRGVRNRPGSSLVLVALCALGVSLSTSIFAVVDSVLLRPLPYRDAGRLVKPWCVAESFGIDRYPFSWDNYRDYRDEVDAFEGLAATRPVAMTLEGASRPVSVNGTRVTENLFDVLGVEPLLGRFFAYGMGEAPEVGSAVISHSLWQRVFAGASDLVGRDIRLDGEPHAVIGVLPPHVRYPQNDSDVFIPLVITESPENRRGFHFLRLVGRLKEGSTIEDADAQAKALALRLAQEYPDDTGELTARVIPLKDEIVGTSRRSLEALFAAVQVLFVIAWTNIAILLLVRGMARRGELELRTALGATRKELFALLVGEACLLAGIGCVLGIGAGAFAVDFLQQVDPSLLPRAHEVRFAPALVLWAVGVTFAGVLLFGSLPAWAATRASGGQLGSLRTTDRRGSRLNGRLVAAQVALALPLLITSSMQLRSVRALVAVDTGYRVEHALVAGVSLPANQFGPSEQKRFLDRGVEVLEQIPGVSAAAAMSHLPLSTRDASIVTYRPDQQGQSGLPNARYRIITPGLLHALGIPLASGREFRQQDDEDLRPIVVIDEGLAEVLFPDREAVGQTVHMGNDGVDWEIVGVAGSANLTSLDGRPDYAVYVPVLQNRFPTGMSTPKFVVRSDVPPRALAPRVRETLQNVDPDQAVLEVRPLVSQIDDWMGERRATTTLLWIIAAAALMLAAAGIYATLSFAVGARLREMAIRSALGAGRARLARSVVRHAVEPGLYGAVAGMGLGLLVGRYLVGTLFGVGALDVRSLALAAFLMMFAIGIASVGPARRALRESPARLMRDDDLA